MNTNSVRIMSSIALILTALCVLADCLIIVAQHKLTFIYSSMKFDPEIFIIPPGIVCMIIELVILVLFFRLAIKCDTEVNRVFGIILLVFMIIMPLLSTFAGFFSNLIIARKGAEYLAMNSLVTSMISIPNMIFRTPALPLFYIACGRYIQKIPEEKKEKNENGSEEYVVY